MSFASSTSTEFIALRISSLSYFDSTHNRTINPFHRFFNILRLNDITNHSPIGTAYIDIVFLNKPSPYKLTFFSLQLFLFSFSFTKYLRNILIFTHGGGHPVYTRCWNTMMVGQRRMKRWTKEREGGGVCA